MGSISFLETILDSLSHPFYVIDAVTSRVLITNRAARSGGFAPFSVNSPGEVPSLSARPRMDSPLDEVRKSKRPLTLEHVHYGPSQQASVHEIHVCPVLDEAGEVGQIVEYHLDVTQRKRAERALRDSEARLRQVVESLPVVLMSRDAATRSLVLLIGAVQEILGYEPDRFLRDRDLVSRIVHPEDIEIARKAVEDSITNKRAFEIEFRIAHGTDGHTVWLRAQGVPICDEDGQLLRIDSILLDVTREKQDAQHREQLERRLQQSQKLESLGVLAEGIAHDFNNQLTVISGNVQFLREALAFGPPETRAFADIEAAVRSVSQMTRSLQAFSRPSKPRIVAVDGNNLIQDVYRFLRRLIPAQIEFECDLAPSPCVMAADPAQLQHVLMQLCINARDALGGKGRLRICARRIAAGALPPHLHGRADRPNYIQLSVSDTGRGMDPRTLGHAFDPFSQPPPKTQGTGLGLAMVYRVVQRHGGLLDVLSSPGQGTQVRIYLPEAHVQVAPRASATPLPSARGTERVLVIDDEEMIASLIKTLLESNGYEVAVALRPEQAIALAENAQRPMDLAVIDYGLPGMGGHECLLKIREHWPGLKALLITGSPVNPAELGLHDVRVLEKPFSAQSITRAVRAALDERPEPPPA